MAEIILNSRIIPRHDISSSWNISNPVLLNGEIGVESDTGLMKIGDGNSAWENLEYIYSGLSEDDINAILEE